MKKIAFLMCMMATLFMSVSCDDDEKKEEWITVITSCPAEEVNSVEGKVMYDSTHDYYLISDTPEPVPLWGTYYVVNNKENSFMKSYRDKIVVFSGTAQRAEIQYEHTEVLDPLDITYYLLDLKTIEIK